MKKVGFVSLGCAKNLTDTETMLVLQYSTPDMKKIKITGKNLKKLDKSLKKVYNKREIYSI